MISYSAQLTTWIKSKIKLLFVKFLELTEDNTNEEERKSTKRKISHTIQPIGKNNFHLILFFIYLVHPN